MDLFVGLDVSVRTKSVCVMDGAGQDLREAKVESEPSAIAALLGEFDGHYRRVGFEAGPLSQWLYSGLAINFFAGTEVDREIREMTFDIYSYVVGISVLGHADPHDGFVIGNVGTDQFYEIRGELELAFHRLLGSRKL
ncbi:hypothetical protein [Paracoccus litorisediminis]|uniref:Transposase n=1 Tax=Paracoccus litorisediminis TaxID=2006130 RepID=A0A844HQM2_9RHOB|nr:hypothetical protein [Paracoccus litorisediminis]MTH61459.1 hypothetical protein [Paracoccus litorisediminis]